MHQPEDARPGRVRRLVGLAVLWVVAVPMFVLIAFLVFDEQSDEVNANSTTTGTVTRHETSGGLSSTYLCWFSYTVDGTEHEAADDCSHDRTPVGSTVTVNYVADKADAGFLHGDKTWWDKTETVVKAGGVITVIVLATFLAVKFPRRRVETDPEG